jgi:hypothetical protein
VNLLKAEIRLNYKNEKEAKAIVKAVSPDNVDVPSGLVIKTQRKGPEVVTVINCKMGLQTIIATIDDLLACVSIAEKTFSITNR